MIRNVFLVLEGGVETTGKPVKNADNGFQLKSPQIRCNSNDLHFWDFAFDICASERIGMAIQMSLLFLLPKLEEFEGGPVLKRTKERQRKGLVQALAEKALELTTLPLSPPPPVLVSTHVIWNRHSEEKLNTAGVDWN